MKIQDKRPERPGGETAKREQHLFLACDNSKSMEDHGKVSEMNTACREALPHILALEESNPGVKHLISVLEFNDRARWVVENKPIENFQWIDLKADGLTAMGEAFELLALKMNDPQGMPERGYPPLVVLISDGCPTDDYKDSLQKFLSSRWGGKAKRMAIGIGKDADHSVLEQFINHPEIKPIQANNPEALAKAIRYVSTVALKQASQPTVGATPAVSTVAENPEDDVW